MLFPKSRKIRKTESQYLDSRDTSARVQYSSRFTKTFYAMISGILSMMFLVSGLSVLFSGNSAVAKADEDDDKETIQKAADDYIPKAEGDDKSTQFFGMLDKFYDSSEKERNDRNSFGYVIKRMFTINYMNNTEKAAVPKGATKKDYQCNVDDQNAGTLIYHNCDVPNILTEIVQDVIATNTQQGIVGADKRSATLDIAKFGLPQDIPGNGAPTDPNDREVKYTALELYGYNLHYTSYNGEWDHIKVMTSARSMSNFGFMDNVRLGATSIAQGVAGGVSKSAGNFVSGLSSGDFFGAIGGAFSGFYEGSTSATINTVLDSSDSNVFTSYAWYRVGYGGTLYNARELTETEMAAKTQNFLVSLLTAKSPELEDVPKDLLNIEKGPEDPKDAISKCTVKDANNKTKTIGASPAIAPGVSKSECKEKAEQYFEARKVKDNSSKGDKAVYTWSVDGTQKKETLKQWVKNNKKIFDVAKKYNLDCKVDTDESVRDDTLASFRLCWQTKYATVAKIAQNEVQVDTNADWLLNALKPSNVFSWLFNAPQENSNAPWSRYVCVDQNGKDILDEQGQPRRLYDLNGDLGKGCSQVRPPIQNGFFGNGYESQQKQPQNDTRWVDPTTRLMTTIIPIKSTVTGIGNAGLTLALFATRVSNTIISVSFNSPLQMLDIDKIIVNLIEGLRDSLFMPLIVLFIGMSAIQIMWNVGRKKDYQNQATSILMICLTIITGIVLMYKPAETIKAVDEVPSMVETAIMGAVFSAGNSDDDDLCYATGSVQSSSFTDLEGKSTGVSAKEGSRVLMCENWKTFAFNPWVLGQWGTDYNHLYAASTKEPDRMKNTNGSLVGDATVNMGGNVKVHNWALYQVDAMSSGTASKKDLTQHNGQVDSDMYRLVDLQAGPNNGKGTDSRYYNTWSGNDYSRAVIGPLAGIIAIVGAITILFYSIAKIQISVTITIMLVMLPFMFLFGIIPGIGRSKLRGFAGSIIGLMIQRIVLVLLLAVLFRIVSQLGSLSSNYWLSGLLTLAVCIFFIIIRKDILRMIFETVSKGFGGLVGQQFMENPKQWSRENILRKEDESPSFMHNTLKKMQVGATAYAGGAIGGYMSGGVKGAANQVKDNALESSKAKLKNLTRTQRRRGFGMVQTMVEAGKQGRKVAQEAINNDPHSNTIRNEAFKNTAAYQQYEKDLKDYNNMVSVDENGKKVYVQEQKEVDPTNEENTLAFKEDENGVRTYKPIRPNMPRRRQTMQDSRNLKKAMNIQKKLDEVHSAHDEEMTKHARNAVEGMDEEDRRSVYAETAYQDVEWARQATTIDDEKNNLEDEIRSVKKELHSIRRMDSETIREQKKALEDRLEKLEQELQDLLDSDIRQGQHPINNKYNSKIERLNQKKQKQLGYHTRVNEKAADREEAIAQGKEEFKKLIDRARRKNN